MQTTETETRKRAAVAALAKCGECGGAGEVPVTIDDAKQLRIAWQRCVLCRGRGLVAGTEHEASRAGRVHRRVRR